MSLCLAIIAMVFGMCYGQTVNLTGPATVIQGEDTIFNCNVTGIPSPTFVWNDISVTPNQQIFVNFESFSEKQKYDNFRVSQSGNTSTLTIKEVELEDAGIYVCKASGSTSQAIAFDVEDTPWFGHTKSLIIIAALAILLVASIIIHISYYVK